MRVTIEFDTDNAAFEDDYHAEIGRVLASAAIKLETGMGELSEDDDSRNYFLGTLRDSNGNTIGKVEVRS